MGRRAIRYLVLILLILVLIAALAAVAVLRQHQGANVPLGSGWHATTVIPTIAPPK